MSDNETKVDARPTSLEEFIGQEHIKDDLRIGIQSAIIRNDAPASMIFSGPSGTGKTNLAQIVADMIGTNIIYMYAPAVKDISVIKDCLAQACWEGYEEIIGEDGEPTNIVTGRIRPSVLFIDEVHQMPLKYSEALYTAMEDGVFTCEVKEGKHSVQKTYQVAKMTYIGATTNLGDLPIPLRNRFPVIYELQKYTPEELAKIANFFANKDGMIITEDASLAIGVRSHGVPREAKNLYKRSRDYAIVEGNGKIIDIDIANIAFDSMRLDQKGLSLNAIRVLDRLSREESPMGVQALCTALSLYEGTYTNEIEPTLLSQAFISRTARGREITAVGREHLDKSTMSKYLRTRVEQAAPTSVRLSKESA